LPQAEPTHRIIHTPKQLEAAIYIAPSLREKLSSSDPKVRQGAESSVAISFRKASLSRNGEEPGGYVKYGDLQISEIDRFSEEPFVPMTHGGDPIIDEEY